MTTEAVQVLECVQWLRIPERVTVDDHATPSVGMYNGECFMFYSSHIGVQRHDHGHGHNAVRSERAKWHKPNDYTQTHGTDHKRQTNSVTRHILSAYVCKCNDTRKPCKYWSVCAACSERVTS